MRLTRLWPWLPGAACCLTAVALVLRPGPALPPPMDADTARETFRACAADEGSLRAQAIADYPTDQWSQDDAFAAFEATRAAQLAISRHTTTQDVFAAIDEGLRAKWELPPDAGVPRATVTPLHPRPID